jgi:hypothetical protein
MFKIFDDDEFGALVAHEHVVDYDCRCPRCHNHFSNIRKQILIGQGKRQSLVYFIEEPSTNVQYRTAQEIDDEEFWWVKK